MVLAIHHDSGKPIRVGTIAEREGIPARFLVQILLQLKGAGLVTSTRGAFGGYQLARHPRDITLWQVVRIFARDTDRQTTNTELETSISRALLTVWNDVADAERQRLESITFARLVEQASAESCNMYYI